MSSLLS